ncbi:MAG: DUF1844 domain-containing protein [Deltaproteobacteria bacterium]|nr:DUF1844 domain-containing protein [Deltaproteobacteria bacterium]
MEEREDKRGFKVQDRRRFSPETGEARETEEPSSPAEAPVQAAPTAAPTRSEEPRREQPRGSSRPTAAQPAISFSSFLLGLSTQALMYMGEIPAVPGQPPHADLAAAQQMIDVLAMLKQKTTGNLDPGESAMLENALFDLRMRYVELVKKGAPTAQGSEQ